MTKVAKMEEDLFDKVLEKLWIHKGAVVDFAENISVGIDHWRTSYILQAEQKRISWKRLFVLPRAIIAV